ncbi:MAG TPA: DUF4440 domain-containing protein [Rhodobacteraceae bacterium]|nr:DUF4440 domain-containing protein [Paracoccaceae bacterium]
MEQNDEIGQFLKLENKIWQALVSGDSNVDQMMLEDGFLGVYSTGFSDKNGHVGQLQNGPTVTKYQIRQPKLLILTGDVVLLAYLADFWRVGSQTQESMYVSSIWRKSGLDWRNIFSQDTAKDTVAPV